MGERKPGETGLDANGKKKRLALEEITRFTMVKRIWQIDVTVMTIIYGDDRSLQRKDTVVWVGTESKRVTICYTAYI